MIEIFLKTLPFFGLILLGFGAGRSGFFPPEATAYLTKFVFYFALSAMLFGFAANLSLAELLDWRAAAAYLWACAALYTLVMAIATLRGNRLDTAVIEAHCAVIGNTGFLGVPLLVVLLGPASVPTVLLVLTIDMIVFSSLFTMLIMFSRDGRVDRGLPRKLTLAVARNPMVMAMVLGLAWSSLGLSVPGIANEFLTLLGAAATPGALFAIGASLADKTIERPRIVGWLSFGKLVLHPAITAFAALILFGVEPQVAGVLIAAAALPVAGNVFILAQHYNIGVARVSATILVSTLVSILTIPLVVAWVNSF
ncbi:MAG: AEC family transporter [Rhodobacteraceae bacterium]|nr:MAG: AEC family transporter [Paracoccaceae bacterium]